MKTRILALLLCLLLVASACLMTACGKKSKEVADAEEREVALASFMKGVESIRKGGAVFTGTIKGTSTDHHWNDETQEMELKTEDIDLKLSLKYNNETFDAVAEGKAGDDSGKYEIYFDGKLVGMLSLDENDVADGQVYFLEDAGEILPSSVSFLAEDYSAIIDQVLALIDLDKVAANISAATKDVISIKTNGKTYTVTVTSDAIFDLAVAKLTILKDSGDKTVAELFDALVGEGSFAKLKTTLEKYEGTDTIAEILPDLEAALTDFGINVDALYAFIGQFLGVEGEDAGAQVKLMLTGMLSEMTINDAIAGLAKTFGLDEMFGAGEAQTYEANMPTLFGGDDDDEEEEESGITYEMFVQMLLSFSQMKVNQLFAMFDEDAAAEGEEFDIAVSAAEAIETVNAIKEAIKFSLSVTCDKKLNPTAIELKASVDTTKLPEDMQEEDEVTKIDLSISAEIKSSVEVAPSTAMQAQIAAAESAREDDAEEEED
ncbi:MAG: hypothetical protein J6Z13_02290 [Clostridia bacterium]|nr:hypothetical protein [Clostridia bacterium]